MRELDLQSRPALTSHVRLQTDATTGEPVLLYPEGIIELSATAEDILGRCDGRTSIEAILAGLAADYEVGEDQLREQTLACLGQLADRSLLLFAS